MNIDSTIVLDAPFVSAIESPAAATFARRPQNIWAREPGESPAVTVATAAVLLLSSLVTLSAFAHVFIG